MYLPSKWEEFLYLVEFAYNNGYKVSLKMSPFQSLYGKRWNTPINLDHLVDRVIIGPELLIEMEEHMVKIKQNLKVAHDRQKSYADVHKIDRSYEVGDKVFLQVRPQKSLIKSRKGAKIITKICRTICGTREVGTSCLSSCIAIIIEL